MERKWWTLIAVCVATFMLLLDITVVNTALPSIAREGFAHGFSAILLAGSGLALVGAVLALALVRDSDLSHDDAAEVPAEPAVA